MSDNPSGSPLFREEFDKIHTLYSAQPAIVQRFLEAQARQIADALIEHMPLVRFSLPDRVIGTVANLRDNAPMVVPENARSQVVGGVKNRLLNRDVKQELRQSISR